MIETFSEQLKDIGRSNKVQQNKMLARSKAIIKSPTYHDLGHNQVVAVNFTPSRDVGSS